MCDRLSFNLFLARLIFSLFSFIIFFCFFFPLYPLTKPTRRAHAPKENENLIPLTSSSIRTSTTKSHHRILSLGQLSNSYCRFFILQPPPATIYFIKKKADGKCELAVFAGKLISVGGVSMRIAINAVQYGFEKRVLSLSFVIQTEDREKEMQEESTKKPNRTCKRALLVRSVIRTSFNFFSLLGVYYINLLDRRRAISFVRGGVHFRN